MNKWRMEYYMSECGKFETWLDLKSPGGWKRQYELLPSGYVWRRLTQGDIDRQSRGKRKLDLSKRVKFDKTDTGMSQHACLRGRV